jgi:hypothetical protein
VGQFVALVAVVTIPNQWHTPIGKFVEHESLAQAQGLDHGGPNPRGLSLKTVLWQNRAMVSTTWLMCALAGRHHIVLAIHNENMQTCYQIIKILITKKNIVGQHS